MRLSDKTLSSGRIRVSGIKSSQLMEDVSPHKSNFNRTIYTSLDRWQTDSLSISSYNCVNSNHQSWILLSGQHLRPNGIQGRGPNIKLASTNNSAGTCRTSEVPIFLCLRLGKNIKIHFTTSVQENYWIMNQSQEILKYQVITYADCLPPFNPLSGSLLDRSSQVISKVIQLTT